MPKQPVRCRLCEKEFVPKSGTRGWFCGYECSYTGMAELKTKRFREEYLKDPKRCGECSGIIPYETHRANSFCSRKCGARSSNRNRIQKGWVLSEKSKAKLSTTLTGRKRGSRFSAVSKCQTCGLFTKGYRRRTCSKECCSILLSKSAFKNQLGRKGMRSGKSYFVTDCNGEQVRLESSFEYELYQTLTELNLRWIRPKFFVWINNGIKHRYYPDFYLCDEDIYLDPKNTYLIAKDANKITKVREQNKIKLYVLDKSQLSKENFSRFLKMVPMGDSATPSPGFQPGA